MYLYSMSYFIIFSTEPLSLQTLLGMVERNTESIEKVTQ